MSRRILPFLLVLILLVSACSVSEGWESTKHVAKSAWSGTSAIVNPNPEIDLDRYKMENPNQEKLARLFTPVDQNILRLMRFLGDQDVYPTAEWVQLLFKRFPWIDGMFVTDSEGRILERKPPTPLKPFSHPLWFEAVWRDVLLKSVVDKTELGPEIYFGTPMYKDVNLVGLIVVHFDPRTLFSFCPDPNQLVIIVPGRGAWCQGSSEDAEALLALPWDETLKDQAYGQVQVGQKYFTWISRYVGRDLYVYATESVDPKKSTKGWLFF